MRKFEGADAAFVARRDGYFANHAGLDARFVVDHWPLFAGYVPLGTLLARYELLKMVKDIPGHLLEFGFHFGAHLMMMAKVMQLLAPNDLRKVYGFDSLTGLTRFAEQDQVAKAERGNYRGELEFLEDMLAVHDLSDRVELIIGEIETTLPQFLADNAHHIYSYIYLDTDLYESTALALRLCWPRLAPGGLIALDEGYHDRYPGEGTALQEFLPTIAGAYDCGQFSFTRQPMIWLRRR